MQLRAILIFSIICVLPVETLRAQDKKPVVGPVIPTIDCAESLVLIVGKNKHIKFRGKGLDGCKEVVVTIAPGSSHVGVIVNPTTVATSQPATTQAATTQAATTRPGTKPVKDQIIARVKSTGKSEAPKPFEASRAGDTEAVVEFNVGADVVGGSAMVKLVTPAGASNAVSMAIVLAGQLIEEKEPNSAFSQPQMIEPGQRIIGGIGSEKDVDVFCVKLNAGESVRAALVQQREMSLMDGAIQVFDESGISIADTLKAGADRQLLFKTKKAGAYYISVSDLNDRGSSLHWYLLDVQRAK